VRRLGLAALASILLSSCTGPTDFSPTARIVANNLQSSNLRVLYGFRGGRDGRGPRTIVLDDKVILGVTDDGGGNGCAGSFEFVGCGTVFELKPSGTGYRERILHRFGQDLNGALPYGLVSAGNGHFYGVTQLSWPRGCGTIFRLDRAGSGYSFTTIYKFDGTESCAPGALPTIDPAGNIYGTTKGGGKYGFGTVFKLSRSPSGYVETLLYSFRGKGDANDPTGSVVEDARGDVFGTTMGSNAHYGAGSAFELVKSSRGYAERIIKVFSQRDGVPFDGLAIDKSGALYGTLEAGVACGIVFRLSPTASGFAYAVLHNFTTAEGCGPDGVTLDRRGNIFGTNELSGLTSASCSLGCGSVFELIPGASGYTARVLALLHRDEGVQPVSGVALSDNVAYGTAAEGGSGCPKANGRGGCGTVFEVGL